MPGALANVWKQRRGNQLVRPRDNQPLKKMEPLTHAGDIAADVGAMLLGPQSRPITQRHSEMRAGEE